MRKNTCRKCIYRCACGDPKKTEPCKGRSLGRQEHEKCVICGSRIIGFGNNPWPIKDYGECCDICNEHVVIPARMLSLIESRIKDGRRDTHGKA